MFSSLKVSMRTVIYISCLSLIAIMGCSAKVAPEYTDNPVAQRDVLAQVSTIGALLDGVYDGTITFGELKSYGGFGLGTVEALDGEMVGFDGDFYQVKSDGVAYLIPDSMETPFACVTFFDADRTEPLTEGMNYEQLKEFLDGTLPTGNVFYAIKIEGTFSYMKTRSVPRQEKPYPPLVEVIEDQTIFEFDDVEGTIVGFRCPAYVSGINVVGYHLHFLTKDKDAGGHVLEFEVGKAVMSVDYTSEFFMILPGEDTGFYDIDLTQDEQDEEEDVEN